MTRCELDPGQTFTLDNKDEPGDNTRVYLPHPEIIEAVEPVHRLLIDDGRLQLVAEKADGKKIVCKVVSGTKISSKKGRQSAGHDARGVGALTDKDRSRPRSRAEGRDRLGGAVLHPASGRSCRSTQDRARPRRAVVEDRRSRRLSNASDEIIELSDAIMVGAWRSRRRDAAGGRSGNPETDHAGGAQGRQAGRRRDANAGIDDLGACADPRRGVRRGDGGFRGRGRGDAVGGIRRRAITRSRRSKQCRASPRKWKRTACFRAS